MFDIINGTEIHLTRGNIACLNFPARVRDINPETGEQVVTQYTYQVGEIVRFKIMKKGDVKQVYLEKDIKITEPTQMAIFNLTGDDTKWGDFINKPTTYWYEVELNPDTDPVTILGYDKEKGPKLFVLYPEGGNKND